jgi:DNA polymerase III epsilon subunit family exonuclease
MKYINDHTLIVLDTETTGLDFRTEKIIEIAAVRLEGDAITGEFHSLINPGSKSIRPSSQKVHGITAEQLADAPPIEAILPDFLAFVGDCPYVAHSAYNDYTFINQATRTLLGKPFDNPRIDSYELFRQLFPDEASHGLDALLERFNLPPAADRHRALGDTMALARVYPALRRLFEAKQAWRLAQLDQVPYLLERFIQVRELNRKLNVEMGEIKEVFKLYFQEGGHALTASTGERLFSDRKRNYKVDEPRLWELLQATPHARRLFKLQSRSLSKLIPTLPDALKTPVLECRTFQSETVEVKLEKTDPPSPKPVMVVAAAVEPSPLPGDNMPGDTLLPDTLPADSVPDTPPTHS